MSAFLNGTERPCRTSYSVRSRTAERIIVGTSQRHQMLAVRGLMLAAILGTTVACDTSSSGVVQTTGPDCPAQLRYHGATYTAFQRHRFAHEQPTKLGSATPVCAGTTIAAGDPVTIWSVPGGAPR